MTRFPFDIVGFDLDGTLLDTHLDLAAAVNHALAVEGRDAIAPASVRDLIGGGAKRLLVRALEETGGPVSDNRFELLHDELLTHYDAYIAVHSRLFPGGEAMLDDLAARGVKIAIVTNKLERFARKLFDALGLTDRFYTIIGGDTLGPGRTKPRPDLLLEMMARGAAVGASGRAAYVGDTPYDTRAAAAAQIPCVAVSFGFGDAPPAELGASAIIDHFDELVPVLSRL